MVFIIWDLDSLSIHSVLLNVARIFKKKKKKYYFLYFTKESQAGLEQVNK